MTAPRRDRLRLTVLPYNGPMNSLFDRAYSALLCADPSDKIAELRALSALWQAGTLDFVDAETASARDIPVPGRPAQPQLVAPRLLKARGLGSAEGRATLIHAIAHIEFNAINLALDAVYRFRGMPRDFYADWLGVALDEARHFELLSQRLSELGHHYGDFPTHDGLWQAACTTAHSCLARMALVPRVLEARGLDVTPGMIERLRAAQDRETIAVLEVILREEVAHVATGTRWFQYCCAAAGVEPEATFLELLGTHARSMIRAPFNREARARAGFSSREMDALTVIAASH